LIICSPAAILRFWSYIILLIILPLRDSANVDSANISANINSANVAEQNQEVVNSIYPAEETLTWGLFLRETLQVIVPALLLAVVIHMFLAQATIVYGEMLVKRVIGLPDETIDIRGGNIYIDNEPLQEQLPHALSSQLNAYPHPIQLGPNEYYVLGDNRSNSNDSRAFGAIQRSEIVGKIWLRYWPLTEFKLF